MSSRNRTLRRTIVAFLVVVGLLVAADFGFAAVAEYKVSKVLRDKLGVQDDPQVTINGFPFLTQAISGDYADVHVDANGVPVQNSLRDLAFELDMKHVHAPISQLLGGSLRRVPIDEVQGSVKVRASDIGRQLHLSDLTISEVSVTSVKSGGDVDEATPKETNPAATKGGTIAGVKLDATTDIAMQRTKITVLGLISLVDGQIELAPKKLKLANDLISGSLPEPLQSQLLKKFVVRVDPGTLPFKVTPTGVSSEQGAITVTGVAHHIVLDTDGAH